MFWFLGMERVRYKTYYNKLSFLHFRDLADIEYDWTKFNHLPLKNWGNNSWLPFDWCEFIFPAALWQSWLHQLHESLDKFSQMTLDTRSGPHFTFFYILSLPPKISISHKTFIILTWRAMLFCRQKCRTHHPLSVYKQWYQATWNVSVQLETRLFLHVPFLHVKNLPFGRKLYYYELFWFTKRSCCTFTLTNLIYDYLYFIKYLYLKFLN